MTIFPLLKIDEERDSILPQMCIRDRDADDAFIRAISYCQKHNIKNSYLWNVLYRDYIFNKTRLRCV